MLWEDPMRPVPIQAAAAEYGVAVETLYRMLRRGQLTRFRRPGDRRTFLDRDELNRVFQYRPEPPEEPEARQ
jgi:predicted site-specific integrase-resolvase